MPSALTYPGVYVEEIPSGVRTIIGVGTSIAAFIGRAARGPVNKPIVINSFGDFDRQFGGVWAESTLGYAVRDFFLNGGSQAVIVRLFKPEGTKADDESKKAATQAKEAADAIVKAASELLKAQPAISIDSFREELAKAYEKVRQKGGAQVLVAARMKAMSDGIGKVNAEDVTVGSLLLQLQAELAKAKAIDPQTDKETAKADVLTAAIKAAKKTGATLVSVMQGGNEALAKALATDVAGALEAQTLVLSDASAGWDANARFVFEKLVAASGAIQEAVVKEISPPGGKARLEKAKFVLEARSEGTWGNELRYRVDDQIDSETANGYGYEAGALFNLTVRDMRTKQTELFRNVAVSGDRGVAQVLESDSELVRCVTCEAVPPKHDTGGEWSETDDAYSTGATGGADGSKLDDDVVVGIEGAKTGLYALEDVDLFNLLCIPPYSKPGDAAVQPGESVLRDASSYCQRRRAMFIVDPPLRATKDQMRDTEVGRVRGLVGSSKTNVALFYPSLRAMSSTGRLEDFAPCGAIAGTFARTDTTRGVWKAPAGIEAGITGASGLTTALTDGENGELNPLAINCLRNMPAGRVIWGSRTLAGDDRTPNDWKYIPVRRTALYIEESLYRGTQWVVFEPNDEPLWAQIRLSVGAFMNDLFRQRAFQGQTPREAYFVKCGKETNPQNDIDKGIVNILVGFAPLKPAEFVVIKLQQIAGEILT